MKWLHKILLSTLLWGCFLIVTPVSALLWEDLGLDLYKQIDEWFYELERAQYEYELTGQWEASISEVVWPILADSWHNCDIQSTDDIDDVIGSGENDQIAFILERCTWEEGKLSNSSVESIINGMGYVRNTFRQRALDKTNTTFDVAKIWLYSDGSIENSPFDLMNDLREIDRVIFTEEIEYEWVPYERSADEAMSDRLAWERDEWTSDEDIDDVSDVPETTPDWWEDDITPEIPSLVNDTVDDHSYVCAPENLSGLDLDDLIEINNDISGSDTWWSRTPYVRRYSGWIESSGTSWGWPFAVSGPAGSYSDVRDEWNCDGVFCITIEFQSSEYGLVWGSNLSIEWLLQRSAGHLEKPANASLTQRKMTTNNFEIGSIISNLPDMLRGFWIEVQTKPVPILDVESQNEDSVEWDTFTKNNLLEKYYKNLWLEYSRRNDLDIYGATAEQTKILQTSAGLPIAYSEERSNQLNAFRSKLAENTRQISLEVDKQILSEDLKDFSDQFAELEIFVAAMEDFTSAVAWSIWQLQQIPSRSP